VLGLEIERRQRALRADPPEYALGHRGVLGEDPGVEPGPLAAEARLSSDLHLKDTNASLTDTGAWWSR
jgi:hypothetical protein